MDWLVWITEVTIVFLIFILLRRIDELKLEMMKVREVVAGLRGHNGTIASRKASSSTPTIDARGRTVIRDTDDLPLTGRMSVAVHREKKDYERHTDDD